MKHCSILACCVGTIAKILEQVCIGQISQIWWKVMQHLFPEPRTKGTPYCVPPMWGALCSLLWKQVQGSTFAENDVADKGLGAGCMDRRAHLLKTERMRACERTCTSVFTSAWCMYLLQMFDGTTSAQCRGFGGLKDEQR